MAEFTYSNYLKEYDLGGVIDIKFIEEGFESDNFLLTTNRGKYVAKITYQNFDTFQRVVKFCLALNKSGFPCPQTVPTKDKKMGLKLDGKEIFSIQEFIEGKPVYREQLRDDVDLSKQFFPKFGKILSSFHQKGLHALQFIPKSDIKVTSPFSNLLNLNPNVFMLPKDKEIEHIYSNWMDDVESYLSDYNNQLTYSLVKGDTKPGDFFFNKSGEFSGMLDFNGVRYGPALEDVANMFYYNGFEKDKNNWKYKLFINSYLPNSPIENQELSYLHLFVLARELVGVFLFTHRYHHYYTQGTANNEENRKSMEYAINSVKQIEKRNLADIVNR